MVKSVTSFSGNGLRDWLWQRVTAVIMAIYSMVLFSHICCSKHLDFSFWHDLFERSSLKILTVLVLLSILIHAWIGMWTVYTDYIKCTVLRLCLQVATMVGLITLLICGVMIVW